MRTPQRVAILGGSSGIGAQLGDLVTTRGGDVFIGSRRLGYDLKDVDSCNAFLVDASEHLGGIDHLVISAGELLVGAVADRSIEEIQSMAATNLVGPMVIARLAFDYLRQRAGSLTLLGSSSYMRPSPGSSVYAATKSGLLSFALSLAQEWAPESVRVNIVVPERTDTPMRRNNFPGEGPEDLLDARVVADRTWRIMASELAGVYVPIRMGEV